MEHLKSHASGDGSLSLVFCEGDTAVSRPVTKEDAIKHLVAKENRHLYDKGYRAMHVNGFWRLVKMYERVGPDRLDGTFDVRTVSDNEEDDSIYTVKIDKNDHFWQQDGTVRIANMFVTFQPDPQCGVGPQEVKNWNVLGSLKFFLSNEREIATQIEDAKAYKAPPLYDESRASRVERHIKGYAGESHDVRANITDIVTDIRHLCEKKGYDFAQIVRLTGDHYSVER